MDSQGLGRPYIPVSWNGKFLNSSPAIGFKFWLSQTLINPLLYTKDKDDEAWLGDISPSHYLLLPLPVQGPPAEDRRGLVDGRQPAQRGLVHRHRHQVHVVRRRLHEAVAAGHGAGGSTSEGQAPGQGGRSAYTG